VCSLFPSSLALCNTSFLEKSNNLSPSPHIKTFHTYLISFSSTQSYAPNVAFLLAVIMNTPKSCHSKQQYFTAHNIYSCNKFILNKCYISPSVPNLHDIDGPNLTATAMDHVTHFVQLASSVKLTHLGFATLPFYPYDAKFLIFFVEQKCNCCLHLNFRVKCRLYLSLYFPRRSKTSFFFRRTLDVYQ